MQADRPPALLRGSPAVSSATRPAGSVKRHVPACALRHRLANRTFLLISISSQHRSVTATKRKRCVSRSLYTMWKLRDATFERCFSPSRISR
jgi:hypothetical protein